MVAAVYRLYTVVPRLVKFVDELTNWYVRMNRRRLKGETDVKDCHDALAALFSVLFTMTKVMVGRPTALHSLYDQGHGRSFGLLLHSFIGNFFALNRLVFIKLHRTESVY